MNTAKCPSCGELISRPIVEIIEPNTILSAKTEGGVPTGIAFVFPNMDCRIVLPISVIPMGRG